MSKEEASGSTLCIKRSTTRAARVCETCCSAPSTVFCRADLAYLCATCDASIHAANKLSWRHERVLVCESCEQAPAAFICKVDAASFCTACDADIHSANLLARLHHRVPVTPIEKEDEDEARSWLLFDEEGGVDEYLDLVEYNSCQDTQFSDDQCTNDTGSNMVPEKIDGGGDAVPIRFEEATDHHHPRHRNFQHGMFTFGMKYEGYGCPASLGQTVSMSSLDVGVVPDSTVQMPTQLSPMDREARVLRYREKKKTRKFVKTIRYASRKAYAETRPRIKGRFAKGTNIDVEVDQMFSTTLMTEGGYCVVPSF